LAIDLVRFDRLTLAFKCLEALSLKTSTANHMENCDELWAIREVENSGIHHDVISGHSLSEEFMKNRKIDSLIKLNFSFCSISSVRISPASPLKIS
jgi:hypothetical protein